MDKMKIDIWSDIACPFCYIGLKKLEQALSGFPNKDKVELVWHSYELNPDFSLNSKEVSAENKSKNHAAELTELGKEAGIQFDFDKQITANTSLALRLVKLAATTKGKATEMEVVLFKAHFSEGKDISDKNVLISLGKEVGLSETEISKMLDSNQFEEEVNNDTKYGDDVLDLEYIPYYLFNNEHVVQGSIPTESYVKVLVKSFKEWEEKGVSDQKGEIISGQSCSIDGVCS